MVNRLWFMDPPSGSFNSGDKTMLGIGYSNLKLAKSVLDPNWRNVISKAGDFATGLDTPQSDWKALPGKSGDFATGLDTPQSDWKALDAAADDWQKIVK